MNGKNLETLLGKDSNFKGTIHFQNYLKIEGFFEGQITSDGTFVVSSTGVVKAEISAKNVEVEGEIHGNIHAQEKVVLHPTAKIFGDIKAKKLMMSQGCSFVGNCDVNPLGK